MTSPSSPENSLRTIKTLLIVNSVLLVAGVVAIWLFQANALKNTRAMHEEAIELSGGGSVNDRFGREMQELVDRGEIAEMIVACRTEAKKHPNSIYVHYYQAVGHYHLNEYVEARQFFDSAKRVDPTWAPTIDQYIHAMGSKGLSAAQ